jgi:tetratricopeptide (TPR) repeat protein
MFTSQNPNPNARRTFVLFRPFVALWHWLFPPTVAHRDRQSKTARMIAIVAIVAFFGGIVTVTVMNARTWYNKYQTWQANKKIDEAEKLEKEERWTEAVLLAQQAYVLDPENPKVVRTMARYYSERGQKESFYFLDKLERLEKPTEEDRLMRIKALVRSRDVKDAQQQIEEVLRTSPPTAKMVEIADQVMQQRGRRQQLLEILRSYMALNPEDQDVKLKLGLREVQFGSPSDVAHGTKILWDLAESPEKAGLQALAVLDQFKLSVEEQRKLVELLEKHPLSGAEHRVAALRRLVALEPARKQEIIEKALLDRKDAKRDDLVPLCIWLINEGEHEKVLAFVKKEMVQDYPPLLMVYLRALSDAKRFDELEKIVNDSRTRLGNADRALQRAMVAKAANKSWEEVNALLVDAIAAAQADARPQNLVMVAQFAEKQEHPKAAEQAYRAASNSSGSENIQRIGFEGLLKLTYESGDSRSFMQTARDTARRWPENELFLERALYASLLAGVEIEMAVAQAQKLLDAKPDDTPRKLLMALAYYRMMDPKEAQKYIVQAKTIEMVPGQAAVIAGILYAGGGDAMVTAQRLAQQIPTDAVMLPEEKVFLRHVRPELAATAANAAP